VQEGTISRRDRKLYVSEFLSQQSQHSPPKTECVQVCPDSLMPTVVLKYIDGGIPRELDDILSFVEGLRSFWCGSNPWMEPPAAVLGESGNIPAVRSYFEDLYREEQIVSRSLKVVLVGREGAGKTRCNRMLRILVKSCLHDWR